MLTTRPGGRFSLPLPLLLLPPLPLLKPVAPLRGTREEGGEGVTLPRLLAMLVLRDELGKTFSLSEAEEKAGPSANVTNFCCCCCLEEEEDREKEEGSGASGDTTPSLALAAGEGELEVEGEGGARKASGVKGRGKTTSPRAYRCRITCFMTDRSTAWAWSCACAWGRGCG